MRKLNLNRGCEQIHKVIQYQVSFLAPINLHIPLQVRKELEACGIECYPQKEFDEDMEDKSDNDKIRVRGTLLFFLTSLISSFIPHLLVCVFSHYVCPIKSVHYRRQCPLQW